VALNWKRGAWCVGKRFRYRIRACRTKASSRSWLDCARVVRVSSFLSSRKANCLDRPRHSHLSIRSLTVAASLRGELCMQQCGHILSGTMKQAVGRGRTQSAGNFGTWEFPQVQEAAVPELFVWKFRPTVAKCRKHGFCSSVSVQKWVGCDLRKATGACAGSNPLFVRIVNFGVHDDCRCRSSTMYEY
jgi:hypothetical protein